MKPRSAGVAGLMDQRARGAIRPVELPLGDDEGQGQETEQAEESRPGAALDPNPPRSAPVPWDIYPHYHDSAERNGSPLPRARFLLPPDMNANPEDPAPRRRPLAVVLLVRHFGLASLTEALTRITWWQFALVCLGQRSHAGPRHARVAVHARRRPSAVPRAPGGAVRGPGRQRGHRARRRRRGGDQGVAHSPGHPLRGQRALADSRQDGGGGGPGLAARHGDPGGAGRRASSAGR